MPCFATPVCTSSPSSAESFRDVGRGILLLVRELWIRVEMVAGLDEFGEEFVDRPGEDLVAFRSGGGMCQCKPEGKGRERGGDGEGKSLHSRDHRKPRRRRQAAIVGFDSGRDDDPAAHRLGAGIRDGFAITQRGECVAEVVRLDLALAVLWGRGRGR
jgi:hypothetical protein